MAKPKRKLVDDIAARLRGLLEDLDRLINPEARPKPARVPVPIRPRTEQFPPKHVY